MSVSLRLRVREGELAICRLPAGSAMPEWAIDARGFLSITRTPDELSIVCDVRVVPRETRQEAAFRAIRVVGPLAFDQVGVIAALVEPLATGRVPVFVVSTFDTDYLLVREERLGEAILLLERAGHRVERSRPAE